MKNINNCVDDFKKIKLQFEYKKYSLYIYNCQTHINRCYKKNIINITERINYLKILNDALIQLQVCYNISIAKKDVHKNIKDQNTYNLLYDLNNTDSFKKVNDILVQLIGKNIGFYNIKDALSLISSNIKKSRLVQKLKNDAMYCDIKLYSKILVILKYDICERNSPNKYYFTPEKDYISLHIIIDNIEIILTGYIKPDPLNIITNTMQINIPSLYKKKELLELSLIPNVDDIFGKNYINNSSLESLLVLSNDEYSKIIRDEYNKFSKLTKLRFMGMLQDFMKDDSNSISNMGSIIRLLLMGSSENIKMAGILFDIIKESKKEIDCDIADMLYDDLSYIYQIKLKKASIDIRTEIQKIKSSFKDTDYKKQLAIREDIPYNVKTAAFEKIKEMKMTNDHYKQQLYVKTVLSYPWPYLLPQLPCVNKIEYLDNIVKKLDSIVYGHKETKDTIKELVGKWISNPTSKGANIGLVGPPGTGKTLIARSLGIALDIPFVQITLGGQNDGELLHGHGYTYAHAQPGMIVKKMVEAGTPRCIIYFDELDKTCKKNNDDEIQNILIHLIDPATNKEFQDRFFQEFTFPLDQVLFIFSYNDSSKINKVLLDRITEIKIKPYQTIDKINIVKQFMIKEMEPSYIIEDPEITYIIDNYTNEPGIRSLKRKMEKIFLKLNIDKIYNILDNNFSITQDLIKKYLGSHNIDIQYIHKQDSIGIVNGLYATEMGNGGILPIQVYNNYANNKLILTGLQKKIMKESVKTAFTVANNILNNTNITGFHIHTPSGAIPKNGPSAGAAFTVAFISRILNKKVRHDIAMTGEIELTGNITKIGGLEYKLMGAKKAGVKIVLVPKENENDIIAIKKVYATLFSDTFKVIFVSTIYDILKLCIINLDYNFL